MSQLKVNSIIPVTGAPTGGGGGIIQVVNTVKSDVFTTNQSAGVEVEITGLNATITPLSSSSKILIMLSVQSSQAGTTYGLFVKRGSTTILVGDSSSSRLSVAVATGIPQDNNQFESVGFTGLDSPATTSAITYKVFGISDGGDLRINRSINDQNNTTGKRCVSTITLMEVSA